MRRHWACLLLGLAGATGLQPALALGLEEVKSIGRLEGGAPVDRAVSEPEAVQLQAARGSSQASIKWSRLQSARVDSKGADAAKVQMSTLEATVAAPLNKDGNDTTLATLDGLGNASSLEIGFKSQGADGIRTGPRNTAQTKAALKAICGRVRTAMTVAGVKPDSEQGCDENEVVKYGSAEDREAYERTMWTNSGDGMRAWGMNAKLGYQDFEFVSPADGKKAKLNETPWSVGVFYAFAPMERLALFTLSLKYQRSFKPGTAGTVCGAILPPASTVTCVDGSVGEPSRVTKKIVALEARRQFAGLGLGITISRDFEAKVTGVELPIVLVKDADGKFTGGVKLGWRSDTRDKTVGLFVGVPFSTTP